MSMRQTLGAYSSRFKRGTKGWYGRSDTLTIMHLHATLLSRDGRCNPALQNDTSAVWDEVSCLG